MLLVLILLISPGTIRAHRTLLLFPIFILWSTLDTQPDYRRILVPVLTFAISTDFSIAKLTGLFSLGGSSMPRTI